MARSETSSSSDRARTAAQSGFTLLELVVALVLFAFIVVEVLADREDAIKLSADARIIQTVRYLAAAKIDEIRHDPERFGDSDYDDFSELNDEQNMQDFSAYTWELEIKPVSPFSVPDGSEVESLFPDDEEELFTDTGEGEGAESEAEKWTVRRVILVVQFEPEDAEARGDLSVKIVTYIPRSKEEEEQN